MGVFTIGLLGGADEDVQLVKDNKPAVSIVQANIEIEIEIKDRDHWQKFAECLNRALKESGASANVNVTVNVPARYERTYRNYAVFPDTGAKIRKLKSVVDVISPCPACPDWNAVLGFNKLPSWDALITEAGKIFRAVWPRSERPKL